MKTIKKISPKSIAKLFGVMYAVIGLIFGLIFSALSLVASSDEAGAMGLIFGIGAVIALPVFYGLMGWVGGYVMGWLYNFFAKRVGGIQIEVE